MQIYAYVGIRGTHGLDVPPSIGCEALCGTYLIFCILYDVSCGNFLYKSVNILICYFLLVIFYFKI